MKYNMLSLGCICLLAAAFLLMAPLGEAQAVPVTFEFSGHITSVLDCDNVLAGAVSEGDLFAGTFTYDTATPDSDPSPWVGAYWHETTPYSISVELNGLSFESNPTVPSFLAEVRDVSDNDTVALSSLSNLMPALDQGLSLILLKFVDPAGQALSSTDLPTSYNLDDWSQEWGGLTLWAGDCISEYTLQGVVNRIENVEINAIPEPGSLLLIGSGLFGLISLRRR